MMRRQSRILSFLLLCFLRTEYVNSFVARQKNAFRTPGRLAASLPVPPPPPPPPNVVDQLIRQASKALENMQLPQLPLDGLTSVQELKLPSLTSVQDQLLDLKAQIQSLDANVLQELKSITSSIQSNLLDEYPQIRPFYDAVVRQLQPILQSPTLSLAMAAVLTFLVANFVLNVGKPPPPSQPYPNQRYDPDTAKAYFDRRLPLVMSRAISILVQSAQFGFGILSDKVNDKMEENQYQRGRELATLLTKLGPTFIKVGQSLSIRTDLLSPAYIRGLETLQDQVPAFETSQAIQILEQEWGRPIQDVLQDDLTDVVAAASLGQVYKATLKETGQQVAIKVQRPDITEQIALDMNLLRQTAPIVKQTFQLNSDLPGTVDAWGAGFVDELDYLQEAENAEIFSKRIQNTPLNDVVFAPKVLKDYSTRSVLVTEWVDGERLDRSSSQDVTVLCSVAMNTYLTMLLELGVLHCDPHPGNLLRVKEDGRLCILDWGMVTRLDKDLQLALIEHMAHLTSADYKEIPRDLLLLGFIPESKADVIDDSGVVEVLAGIYSSWTKGGGAASVNVNDVINQLQDLTAEKGNLFQIPPYFAYIAKSFSVLEGIGLSNDPKYSIVNECLPYVSKRLLTDKDRMGPALSTFIFGPEKHKSDRIVNYRRVEQLVEGFGNYTTSSSGALLGKANLSRTELLEDSADQILDLVFADEETPLQQILLEQLAKIISASGRTVFTELRERSGTLPSGRTVLGTIVDPLGLWRTSPLVRTNELDEKTVETTRKLVTLLQRQVRQSENPAFDLSDMSREEAVELASILVRKVWARRSGVVRTGNRFARVLLQLTAEKLELGERDTRLLPERTDPAKAIEGSSSAQEHFLQSRPPESRRLQEARKLLDGLQNDDSTAALPEATSVETGAP